jgi:hypothetical protein
MCFEFRLIGPLTPADGQKFPRGSADTRLIDTGAYPPARASPGLPGLDAVTISGRLGLGTGNGPVDARNRRHAAHSLYEASTINR